MIHSSEHPRGIAFLVNRTKWLFPGYFALVMATGIISIACESLGMRPLALLLTAFNWAAYLCLWGLTLARLVRFRKFLLFDVFSLQRAPGFFTLVAGTCVLGAQNIIVLDAHGVALAFWWLGAGLGVGVMYAVFTAVTVRARKPALSKGISGAWLIAPVAAQSLVVLRTVIDIDTPPSEPLQFVTLGLFMVGAMLYLAIIPLIFYRLTFVALNHLDFSPPYWINMGAVAISALAGSLLIQRSEVWPLIGPLLPFIRGLTFFFWAVATWWIPLLLALLVWRYVWKKDTFHYDPAVWGMVFPLGMYTTSTIQFDRAMGYSFLDPLPAILLTAALTAWALAAFGLARQLLRTVSAA